MFLIADLPKRRMTIWKKKPGIEAEVYSSTHIFWWGTSDDWFQQQEHQEIYNLFPWSFS